MTNHAEYEKPSSVIADPRVFFAAERTLLAWVRCGLGIMAIGFVVAKFGLFLKLLAGQHATKALIQTNFANHLGCGLVLVSVLIVIIAQYNHQHFLKTLMPQDIPYQAIKYLPILLTSLLSFTGLVLATYLLMA